MRASRSGCVSARGMAVMLVRGPVLGKMNQAPLREARSKFASRHLETMQARQQPVGAQCFRREGLETPREPHGKAARTEISDKTEGG